ncbi:MAG TPA: VOC family protein [Candidatus Saccharimonadales bacterium]|nr:VOC family protein [Candidatus Saccharimonadales bacterium]
MQKITPFLWFDKQAEEAASFYTSVFKDGKITHVSRYDAEGAKVSGQPEGTAMVVAFQINGQDFTALNGGPQFKFNEAISFMISCEDQEEVDYYWEKLSAVPESEQCGWLKDKYGLSWQVVPTAMGQLMSDPDPVKAQRVMHAMLQMKKIIIADLQKAHDQE